LAIRRGQPLRQIHRENSGAFFGHPLHAKDDLGVSSCHGDDPVMFRSRAMNWLLLFFAGVLEVIWAIGLKHTQGFTRLTPTLLTLGAMVGSFYCLSVAMRTLPLGTAYAVWVGIGAIGTAIAGIILFHETVSTLKLCSLALIVVGIVGHKLASAP
jgi:quaternary ammonium compound-resistance protein SugE